MGTRPKVLLLDFGNVTVRLTPERLLAGLSARRGRAVTPQEWVAALNDPEGRHYDYERGRIGGPEFHAAMARRLGLEIPWAEWKTLWNSYFEPNRPMEALVARLGTQLRFWGLSNTNAEHLAHLRLNYRVLRRFEGITASCEVGCAKPEAAIYRAALAALKVAPEEALYLDDVPEYVAAGAAAGLQVFHYTFNDLELKERLRTLGFELKPLEGASALRCA
jgi:putative hydrolase of the HAD superfamily